MYTFVSGGFRSGRSDYALKRAAELGPPPWLYVTAGEETDDAIRKRIEKQRKDQDAIWRTSVMPADLAMLIEPEAVEEYGAVVLDGLPGWIASRLGKAPPSEDAKLLEEVERVAVRLSRGKIQAVLVSQEMGWGVVPQSDDRFVRVVSTANRIFAQDAQSVVVMVSGVPLRVR